MSDLAEGSEKLRWKFLDEDSIARLAESNPNVLKSPSEFCPTCATTGSYVWKGVTRKCDCQLQVQLFKHYLNAGIGLPYQRYDWEDYKGDPELKELTQMFADNLNMFISRGSGITAWGGVGTGKTFSVMMLLKRCIQEGYSCFSVTFADLVSMLTAGWKNDEERMLFKNRVLQSQVLLIDDIGKEMKNRLTGTTFDSVIRTRVQAGLSTMITTNLTMEELEIEYGEATKSLLTEVNYLCHVDGDDYRPERKRLSSQELLEVRPIV